MTCLNLKSLMTPTRNHIHTMMACSLMLIMVAIFTAPPVSGHGFLSIPTPRLYANPDQRNEPISVPWGENMKCKNLPARTPSVTLTAGESITVRWNYTANHKGDCFMYLSYDGGSKWFKIAQWAKCNEMNMQRHQMMVPSWVPSCNPCIMRYEWYAIHMWPKIELYVDCVDVKIVGSPNGGQLPSSLVSIPGHLPLNGGTASNPLYRNEYNRNMAFFFTGPAVASVSTSGSTATVRPSPVSSSTGTSGSTPITPITPRSSSSSTGTTTMCTCPPTSSTGSSNTGSPTVIQITQRYNIKYSTYTSDKTVYSQAFLNTLAYSSIPRLDPDALSVQTVAEDGSGVKVTFYYKPDVSSSALVTSEDVAAAIEQGRKDNTTESMELDFTQPVEVLAVGDDETLSENTDKTSSTDTRIIIYAAAAGAAGGALLLGMGIGMVMWCRRRRSSSSTNTNKITKEQPATFAPTILTSPTPTSTTTQAEAV